MYLVHVDNILTSDIHVVCLVTYLHVLVGDGEGVWSQWQVPWWKVSQEDRRSEEEDLKNTGVTNPNQILRSV